MICQQFLSVLAHDYLWEHEIDGVVDVAMLNPFEMSPQRRAGE